MMDEACLLVKRIVKYQIRVSRVLLVYDRAEHQNFQKQKLMGSNHIPLDLYANYSN